MEKLSEVKQALKYLEIDAKAYADNFSASMIVSTKNILAIAEAFRALDQEVQKNLDGALAWQQRAEAAEAERSALQDGFAEAIRHKDRLADELNELAKQEPAGHFMLARDEDDSWWHEASEQNDKAIPLYTRPAPAADLMPGEWTNEQCLKFLSIAFRHAEISGDIEMDDIRLAVKMVTAGANNHQ